MSYIGNEPISAAFLTDTFSGNGSTVAFTMTVAPANTSSILVAVTGVVQDPSTYSVSGTTLTFSAAPPTGTSNISVRYLGIPASGVTTTAYRTVTDFTATAGQTTFSVPSYTVGYIDVYRNGVRLAAADYTATNGTTVVLAAAATAGDSVVTESFYVSSVLNAIANTGGSVSASNLAASGTPSSSTFLRGDMAWTASTGTGSVALSSLPTFATTIGVGGATAAASGSGITFPASQSASSDANTLDDYEEGTWTPTLGGNTTYTDRSGGYVKIGRLVWLKFLVRVSSIGTGSNYLITGLPFTYSNDGGPRSSGACNYFGSLATSVTSISWNVDANGIFAGTTNGSTTGVTDGNGIFGNNTYVMGSVTYYTTA